MAGDCRLSAEEIHRLWQREFDYLRSRHPPGMPTTDWPASMQEWALELLHTAVFATGLEQLEVAAQYAGAARRAAGEAIARSSYAKLHAAGVAQTSGPSARYEVLRGHGAALEVVALSSWLTAGEPQRDCLVEGAASAAAAIAVCPVLGSLHVPVAMRRALIAGSYDTVDQLHARWRRPKVTAVPTDKRYARSELTTVWVLAQIAKGVAEKTPVTLAGAAHWLDRASRWEPDEHLSVIDRVVWGYLDGLFVTGDTSPVAVIARVRGF